MMLHFDCFSRVLTSLFYQWGKFVARHPVPWIIIPILMTGFCQLGWLRFQTESDIEYLYIPVDAPSRDEFKIMESFLPLNQSHRFTPTRKYDLEGFFQAILTREDKGNIFNPEGIQQLLALHQAVISNTVLYEGLNLTFEDVCAAWEGQCFIQPLVYLVQTASFSDLKLTFPYHSGPQGQNEFLGNQLAGVKLDSHGHIESAEAFLFWYYANSDWEESRPWLDQLKNVILDYEVEGYNVVFQLDVSLEEELEKSSSGGVSSFSITYAVLFSFAVLSCLSLNPLRSKPWVAISGELMSILASVSSIGFVSACGIPVTTMALIMPFLIAGIGLDDTFVVISSWRNTPVSCPLEERVGRTMRDAAVSVTLTSLTDSLAFGIGAVSPFRSVSFFCMYTAAGIIFSFLYVMMMLTACIALSGKREEENRHFLTCRQVTKKNRPPKEIPNAKFAKQLKNADTTGPSPTFDNKCNGDTKNMPPKKSEVTSEEVMAQLWINSFLSGPYATFISSTPVRIIVCLLYLTYAAFTVLGITRLEEGLDLVKLVPGDSYMVEYFELFNPLYRERYGPNVMLLIREPLDYTDETTQGQIHDFLQSFRDSRYFYDDEIVSWYDTFQAYLAFSNRTITQFTDMREMIFVLRNEFLPNPRFQYFQEDIRFDENFTDIIASRFFVQGVGGTDAVFEKNLMLNSRKLGKQAPFAVTTFNIYFLYFDQYAVVLENTLKNTGIALACMMFTSLVLIPSFVAVVWVTVVVLSICMGIVGYMALWGVALDGISMVGLIMSIGFSVDFAAHISYHYVVSEKDDKVDKARDALRELGYPILQAGISTILGVAILGTTNSYIFQTFFKIVTLVMVFGIFHALILLPAVMPLLSTDCPCRRHSKDANKKEGQQEKYVTQYGRSSNEQKQLEKTHGFSNGYVNPGIYEHDVNESVVVCVNGQTVDCV